MNRPSSPIPLLTGLSEIAAGYRGFVLDLWGVLHDGVTAFPEAVECLARLREDGQRILILSNAPRRADEVAARCTELGIAPSFYDALLSSGEDAWQHLKGRRDPFYAALGRRCYHLGPERDRGLREGLDLDFVEDPEAADFVLNTGADAPEDTVDTYAAIIETAIARGLPMVCANPDLEVIRGGKREICAGAIAARYEELGGQVRYHGKPYPGVYETGMALLGLDDPGQVLAIGDSLRTDIAGAKAAGMASLLVLSGIHGEELGMTDGRPPAPETLARLCQAQGLHPEAAMAHLAW